MVQRLTARFLALGIGSAYGSFLNVLAYRLPREESSVFPRSRCPHCKNTISWYDNVPVLSWFWLSGRCRRCRGPISWRYPAVEALMGLLSLALYERYPGRPVWMGGVAVACGLLIAVALIDWDTFLIPDELSLGLAGLGMLFSPVNPLWAEVGVSWRRGPLNSLGGAAVGFLMGYATAILGERLFKKESLGGGDVKLLAAVGSWSGALGAFDCLMIGSILGLLYGLPQLLKGLLKRSEPIPFGPFLSAGAIANFFILLPWGFPFIR